MAAAKPRKLVTPLRVAIAESGLTQREIAAQVGIHESYLSRIVSGLHIDDGMRESIADAIGRRVDEVFSSEVGATAA